jgi:hypothetical protein
MRIYVDVVTGEIRRSLTGAAIPILSFYQNDIFDLEVVLFSDDTEVTASTLSTDKTLDIVLRGVPYTISELATGETPTREGEVVSAAFDLTTQAVTNYFSDYIPAGRPSGEVFFEIQISKPDGTYRETILFTRALLFRDLNTGNTTDLPANEPLQTQGGAPLTLQDGSTPITTQ